MWKQCAKLRLLVMETLQTRQLTFPAVSEGCECSSSKCVHKVVPLYNVFKKIFMCVAIHIDMATAQTLSVSKLRCFFMYFR